MIRLDTEQHVFVATGYEDLTAQLLEHLDVQDDTALAALAAACLGCTDLDVMITHTEL